MSKETWKQEKESNFDILKIKPEDFASQLTLRDLPVFKKITAEELTSGEWTNKNRNELAPNIAEFTYRFNMICLWTQREILSLDKTNKRAELIEHFLWISKKLIILNNIHACFAIVAALLSQSIYRLSKTWNKVGTKEKSMFEKFFHLFSSENNWSQLRKFTDSRKIPCIPHIGIYLTDLMFIQNVMKRKQTPFGERSNHELNMDSMIRTIASFQDSSYDELEVIPELQRYLESICFDRNEIKTEEERLYCRSLEIEPGDGSTPKRSSFSYLTNLSFRIRTPSNPHRNSLTTETKTKSLTPSMKPKFIKSHRKAQSLGNPSGFG